MAFQYINSDPSERNVQFAIVFPTSNQQHELKLNQAGRKSRLYPAVNAAMKHIVNNQYKATLVGSMSHLGLDLHRVKIMNS